MGRDRERGGKGRGKGLIVLFMNIILHTERSQGQAKPKAIKVVVAMRRQRRSVTEQHHQPLSPQKPIDPNPNPPPSQSQKPKDFSSIFAKHRRSEYSGYKQLNLNQSPIIKLSAQIKLTNRYETSRKYEINLKNIAKLRKRHSLEPIHFKDSERSHQRVFGDGDRTKAILTLEEIDTGRKCHRDLKEAIREMGNRNHNSSVKFFGKEDSVISKDKKTNESSISKHEEKLREGELTPTVKKAVQIQQIPKLIAIHKSSYGKAKKSSRIRIPMMQKRREADIEQEMIASGESQLHGWSTHSFYPKKKPLFFAQSNKQDPLR